ELCRAFGATALTVGSDIYFREEAFAPHTPKGLRLLAHEVAHVVQQHRGPVAAVQAAGGLAVAPAGSAGEREADAAADALLPGRPGAAPARQRAGGDARGAECPARLPGPPGGDRERAGGIPASADPVRPEPEHRGAAPAGRVRVPARLSPPATGLAEVPAAAP